MGGMKISELDFLRLLPAFMRDDEAVIALSKAMNQLMGEPGKQLSTLRTWDKIDELSESECDELAWELDIDWYDSTGMNLSEKRETIKLAQQIKRKRGTKWAVERLINAYFGDGYVLEWDEINGTPFTFEVLTTNANISTENYEKFIEAAKAAKNERSHIAGIFYYWQQGTDSGVEYALNTSLHRYNLKKCGKYPRTVTVGFIVKSSIETEPAVKLQSYEFTKCGKWRCSESDPKKCFSLVDRETGQGYMLYVSAGKLTMKTTAGKVTKSSVIFSDAKNGANYQLYVSAGKLTMETSNESATVNNVICYDHITGEKYQLYVSAGKLTMKTGGE